MNRQALSVRSVALTLSALLSLAILASFAVAAGGAPVWLAIACAAIVAAAAVALAASAAGMREGPVTRVDAVGRLDHPASSFTPTEIAVFESIEDGLIAVARNGRVRYVNRPAARILALRTVGETDYSLATVLRDHEVFATAWATLTDDQRRTLVVGVSPGGVTMEVTIVAPAPGSDLGMLLFLRDVSEARRREAVRRDFVGNVSHELRTPIAAIQATVEVLEAGAIDRPEVAREFLAGIHDENDRLARLVEELLELGRIESGQTLVRLESVDPRAVLHEATRRMQAQAERRGLVLIEEPGEPLPMITADGERLARALVNLLHNALKFTPQGGTVTLRVELTGDAVRFAVQDTGTGIPEVEQARIFNRFYKAEGARFGEGAGLGLAIVKHVVEAHGGSVSVSSSPGHGSIFTLRLPVNGTMPT